MKKLFVLLIASSALALSGCAYPDYYGSSYYAYARLLRPRLLRHVWRWIL